MYDIAVRCSPLWICICALRFSTGSHSGIGEEVQWHIRSSNLLGFYNSVSGAQCNVAFGDLCLPSKTGPLVPVCFDSLFKCTRMPISSSIDIRYIKLLSTQTGTNGCVSGLPSNLCFESCWWAMHKLPVQGGWGGCRTGNGKKLSNSQACCLAQLRLAAA